MRLIDVDKLLHQGYDYVVDGWQYDTCNKSMDIEDIPTVEAIPKADYEARLKADLVEVIDKIRAEIETKYGQCKLTEYNVQYDGICTSVNDIGDIADILQILDKYKAETEAEDGNK